MKQQSHTPASTPASLEIFIFICNKKYSKICKEANKDISGVSILNISIMHVFLERKRSGYEEEYHITQI